MKTTIAKVIQAVGEEPVPVEILAKDIQAISAGIKKLLAGPLNERALVLLIQDASPTVLTQRHIKAVIAGLGSLEATFLKRKS
jgi:hypothetical protein